MALESGRDPAPTDQRIGPSRSASAIDSATVELGRAAIESHTIAIPLVNTPPAPADGSAGRRRWTVVTGSSVAVVAALYVGVVGVSVLSGTGGAVPGGSLFGIRPGDTTVQGVSPGVVDADLGVTTAGVATPPREPIAPAVVTTPATAPAPSAFSRATVGPTPARTTTPAVATGADPAPSSGPVPGTTPVPSTRPVPGPASPTVAAPPSGRR